MAEGRVHGGPCSDLFRRPVNGLLAGSQGEAAQSELDLSAVFHCRDAVQADATLSVTFAQLISDYLSLSRSLSRSLTSRIHTLFDLF